MHILFTFNQSLIDLSKQLLFFHNKQKFARPPNPITVNITFANHDGIFEIQFASIQLLISAYLLIEYRRYAFIKYQCIDTL